MSECLFQAFDGGFLLAGRFGSVALGGRLTASLQCLFRFFQTGKQCLGKQAFGLLGTGFSHRGSFGRLGQGLGGFEQFLLGCRAGFLCRGFFALAGL